MSKKLLMQNAHRITKKLVEKYGVDYKTQLGISMKYVYSQLKLYAQNEIKNYRKNIILTLNKLVNNNDERFNKYYELYLKYNNLSNSIIQNSYYLKSLNSYMAKSLNNNYVIFNPSYHEEHMITDACKNISLYLKQR